MAVEERLDLPHVLLVQADPVASPQQLLPVQVPADFVADGVAEDRPGADEDHQVAPIKHPLRSQKAAEPDQCFAWYDKAKEGRGFQHHGQKDDQVPPVIECADEVAEAVQHDRPP